MFVNITSQLTSSFMGTQGVDFDQLSMRHTQL